MEFGNKNSRVVLHKIINSLPRKNALSRAFDHDVTDEIMSYNKNQTKNHKFKYINLRV